MDNKSQSSLIEITDQQLTEQVKTLPLALSVQNVADFLGVCLSTAYVIVNKPDFPKKKINGVRRYIIPKLKFIEWYLEIN